MRRLLPALAFAQALGVVAADRGWLGARAALVLGGASLALGLLRRGAGIRGTAALGLALAAGALSLARQLDEAQRHRPAAAQTRTVEARIAAVTRREVDSALALTRVRAVDGGPPVPGRVRVAGVDPSLPVVPGMAVRVRARLRAPVARRNPGGRGDPRRLARRGIGAVGGLAHPRLLARRPDADARARVALEGWRLRVGERLARVGPGGGLLRALALGDGGDLARGDRERFAALGVAHLLAVSGLHLALVAVAVHVLARRALARSATLCAHADARDLARALALLAAGAYALGTGFGVPVRRALVLVAAVVAAALRGRRSPPLHPLAGASLAVLALDPAALFSAGAQLSFAACGALLVAARRREDAAPGAARRARWIAGVRTSAIASAATAPLAALHLGVAAPLAIAANAIAVPWTGAVLLPAALLAAAAAAGSDLAAPGGVLERALAGGIAAAGWLGARTLDAVGLAAPLAPHRSASVPAPWAIGVAALGAVATARARHTASAVGLAVAVAAWLWWAPPPAHAPPPPRLVVLDVGRGDAILVQGAAASVLVDAGAAVPGRFDLGASAVVPALRALGVTRLDLVVVTHADLDHRGGVPAVLRALPVDAVWIPFGAAADPGLAEVRAAAHATRVPVRERGAGSPPQRLGDLRVEPVWPPRADADPGDVRNERSLGLRIAVGASRVLLLGDLGRAEPALLARTPRDALEADVLVLPHHGSRGSSGAALLAAARPAIAIVSAPCPPQRALPHPDALERARARGASLWWTGRDGAVSVGLEAPLVVGSHAPPRRCGP